MHEQVRQALTVASARLADASDTPRLDAEVLMAHAFGVTREALLLCHLEKKTPDAFAALVERRARREPVAYITGSRDFWTITLNVTPDVLIPRPDTETLIDAALERIGQSEAPSFLDLGTGSGALLLAALDEWPNAWGVGVDRSAAAIRIARQNARRLGLAKRATFVVADWCAAISGSFDGIFCNPPYIRDDANLPGDVADYEPGDALFAGADGLDDYRRLIPRLPALLAGGGGCAFLEIGADQARAVAALALAGGMIVEVRQDLAGHDRCAILSLP